MSVAEKIAPQPWGFTVFCDDIRQEIGNKVSFMGVFANQIHTIQPYPFILSRIGVAIHYREPIGWPPKPTIIRVTLTAGERSEVLLETEVETLEARSNVANDSKLEPDGYFQTAVVGVFENVEITEGTTIKVRAHRGDLEVRLGKLEISSRPAGPTSSPS